MDRNITLKDVDFSNINFWVGFLNTSFPTALDKEKDENITEILAEVNHDASWWDEFTYYYDGVLEENDGYADKPRTLSFSINDDNKFKIEFHPGDTLFFLNGTQIGQTGPSYKIQVLKYEEISKALDNETIFFLLLPLLSIQNKEKDIIKKRITDLLSKIIDKELAYNAAGAIVSGLLEE